jgi:hypothetical protein
MDDPFSSVRWRRHPYHHPGRGRPLRQRCPLPRSSTRGKSNGHPRPCRPPANSRTSTVSSPRRCRVSGNRWIQEPSGRPSPSCWLVFSRSSCGSGFERSDAGSSSASRGRCREPLVAETACNQAFAGPRIRRRVDRVASGVDLTSSEGGSCPHPANVTVAMARQTPNASQLRPEGPSFAVTYANRDQRQRRNVLHLHAGRASTAPGEPVRRSCAQPSHKGHASLLIRPSCRGPGGCVRDSSRNAAPNRGGLRSYRTYIFRWRLERRRKGRGHGSGASPTLEMQAMDCSAMAKRCTKGSLNFTKWSACVVE